MEEVMFALTIRNLIVTNDIINMEKFLIIHKDAIEELYINEEPCFIYALNVKSGDVFNLFVKYKLDPNVTDTNNKSLLRCVINNYFKYSYSYDFLSNFINTYSNIDFTDVVNDYFTLKQLINNKLDFVLSNTRLIYTIKLKFKYALNLFAITLTDEISCKSVLIKFVNEIKYLDIWHYTNTMQILISQYLQNNSIIYKWICEIGEPISYLFTLIILLCDDYLELN